MVATSPDDYIVGLRDAEPLLTKDDDPIRLNLRQPRLDDCDMGRLPMAEHRFHTGEGEETALEQWCRVHLQPVATWSRSGNRSQDLENSQPSTDLASADLLSVRFTDGSVLHTRPEQWIEVLAARGQWPPAGQRSKESPDSGVALPFELVGAAGVFRSGIGHSGVSIDTYTTERLTEPSTLDIAFRAGEWLTRLTDSWFGNSAKTAAAQLAAKLCRMYENSQLEHVDSEEDGALLHWRDGNWVPLTDRLETADRRIVLLLHGTASSTRVSFGELTAPSRNSRELPQDFAALSQSCHLLAWEHRTLTCSPIANVIGLAQALSGRLPEGAQVHLLSHSRGGLVGDLLSIGLQPPHAQQPYLDHLRECLSAAAHPDERLLPSLRASLAQLASFTAGTFVRVASPSRGTLLADGRTDLFLSLLLRTVGLLLGGEVNRVYQGFSTLVRGLVSARADASMLPGLEAMIPGSPLTLALNTIRGGAAAPLPGALRVIAGDCAPKGLSGLLTIAADIFYGLHDHDLVVHTQSMFGGFPRHDAKSLRLENQSVSHFNYFKPDSLSRGPLLGALSGEDSAFRGMDEDERITRGRFQMFKADPWCHRPRGFWDTVLNDPDRAGQSIVILLPGIMGSELSDPAGPQDGRRPVPIWLSLNAMAGGDLARLELSDAEQRSPLVATSLMPIAYERLLEAAHSRYRVIPWPYDWRRSIAESADALSQQLRQLIDDHPGVPVHLLAHSMGGLVARHALWGPGRDDTVWQTLKRRGSRLLMLGTPNAGSYAPVQLLSQQHALSKLLACFATKVSSRDMAEWGGRYAGLLQMLPAQGDKEFGDLLTLPSWKQMQQADSDVRIPDPDTLEEAREFIKWRTESASALRAETHVMYVAGIGSTPAGLARPLNDPWSGGEAEAFTGFNRIRFLTDECGDGTVGWDSCLDPDKTWYVDCSHGDLADRTEAFGAYFTLLEGRRPETLTQSPPRSSGIMRSTGGGTSSSVASGPGALPFLPEDPSGHLLGMGRIAMRPATALPITIHVVHGGLDYARFPLIVGHYQDDGILGGTKRVDEKLDGQLSRIVELKLFTGVERTAVYLRPPIEDQGPPSYPGAIIVGLGSMGELTSATLSASVTRAVLRFAFEHLHRDPWIAPTGEVLLRLSSLLVGTHVQAVSARDSLSAVLSGIWRANLHLQEGTVGRPMRIAEVEFIEIHEQVALDAGYELRRLLQRAEWMQRLDWPAGTVESRSGGIRGFAPNHVDSVWQRLIVRQHPLGGLRFELIAERARVEATQVQSDIASLKNFLSRLSEGGVVDDEGASEFGRVLFQLLLPQALKTRLTQIDDTVLVVDQQSAAYPWELMIPPDEEPLLDDGPRPLALQAGFIRQRIADEFRALPTLSRNWRALVIGAPDTSGWTDDRGAPLNFGTLEGARSEAEHVAQSLHKDHRPWQVSMLLGKEAPFQVVRLALLTHPYRLLHLCGHGVVNAQVAASDEPTQPAALCKTGLVLSDGHVLTAADIEQMSHVPEFVFINACHSAKDGDAERLAPMQRELPLLASSLALQFIKMGSRAVVAAGWQVDDADARIFSEALYRALLNESRTFGEAVLEARQTVRARGRGGNTWGAYQCYGDPNWRIADASVACGYARHHGSRRLEHASGSMSRIELTDRVLQVVALAGDKPRSALLMQLEDLIRTLQRDERRRDWLRHSDVCAAFGKAFRELGDHERAVQWIQAGVRRAYSRVSLRDIEFMVNSLSRLGSSANQSLAEQILDKLDAIDDDRLTYHPPLAPRSSSEGGEPPSNSQSERDCLRGSNGLHRGHAALRAEQRKRHYLQACGDFIRGYAGKLASQDDVERRAYALSSGVLSGGLAMLCGAAESDVLAAFKPLGEAHSQERSPWEWHCQTLMDELERADLSTTFWHYTNRLELVTARALLRVCIANEWKQKHRSGHRLSRKSLKQQDAVLTVCRTIHEDLREARLLLRHALVRWPSPVEAESIRDRLAALARCGADAKSVHEDMRAIMRALLDHADQSIAMLATKNTGIGS